MSLHPSVFPVAGNSRRRRRLLLQVQQESAPEEISSADAGPDVSEMADMHADGTGAWATATVSASRTTVTTDGVTATEEANSDRGRLRTLLGKPGPLTWVMCGDSLRLPSSGVREWRSSAGRITEYLHGRMSRSHDVLVDTATPGMRIEKLIPVLWQRVLKFRPDVVLISIGQGEAEAGLEGLEEFERRLAMLVETLQKTGIVTAVSTPPLAASVDSDEIVLQLVYAEATRATAAEYDLPLVDHWAHWEQHATEGDVTSWYDGETWVPGKLGHVEIARRIVKDLGLQDRPIREAFQCH